MNQPTIRIFGKLLGGSLSIVALASCAPPHRAEEFLGGSGEALTVTDTIGFESTSGWTLSSGTATLTTNRTQGSAAFSVIPNGWLQMTSLALSSLGQVTGIIGLDFGMPSTAPNGGWRGMLQLSVNMPSHGLFNVLIGQTDLSTLPLGKYTSVQYPVPSAVASALGTTYTDLQFYVVVNVPSSTSTSYLIDNLHFVGVADGGADDASARDGSREAETGSQLCGTCPAGTACASNGLCLSTDLTVWPNTQSVANSDTWISQNHTTIRQMNPRVLALNFVNTAWDGTPNSTLTQSQMIQKISTSVCAGTKCSVFDGLALGSKYHGYSNSSAPAFLNYSLAYAVDLSDKGHPPAGWNHKNSSRYPTKCVPGDGYQFDFAALFSRQFASYYNIRDARGTLLTLAQAIQLGLVHEVFIYVNGDPDTHSCAVSGGGTLAIGDFQLPEVLEWKQNYTDPGATSNPSQKIVDSYTAAAGNGAFDNDDLTPLQALGHSIRFLYVNSMRGSGCALHSLGHGIEHSADTLPALGRDFVHFANFDLATKSATPTAPPFSKWYDLFDPTGQDADVIQLLFPNGATVSNGVAWSGAYSNGIATTGTIKVFNQGCGSVHYPPNARKGYDDVNSQSAAATCENYGLHNSNGLDLQTPVSNRQWTTSLRGQPIFDTVAQADCEGGWNIYWRQSFPGYGNKATQSTSRGQSNGVAIKNWWPYLFY